MILNLLLFLLPAGTFIYLNIHCVS